MLFSNLLICIFILQANDQPYVPKFPWIDQTMKDWKDSRRRTLVLKKTTWFKIKLKTALYWSSSYLRGHQQPNMKKWAWFLKMHNCYFITYLEAFHLGSSHFLLLRFQDSMTSMASWQGWVHLILSLWSSVFLSQAQTSLVAGPDDETKLTFTTKPQSKVGRLGLRNKVIQRCLTSLGWLEICAFCPGCFAKDKKETSEPHRKLDS